MALTAVGGYIYQWPAATPQKGLKDATQADLSNGDSWRDPLHLSDRGGYTCAADLFFHLALAAGILAALVAAIQATAHAR